MNNTNDDCEILVELENESYKITLDKNEPMSKVIPAILDSFSLDNQKYELYFQDKSLSLFDNNTLSKLIDFNKQTLPIFNIKKKGIINNQNNLKTIDLFSQKHYLIIYNSLGFDEVNNIIKDYNNVNQNNQGMIISDWSDVKNGIMVMFNNFKCINEFNEYFNHLKINNPNLERLKIEVVNNNKNYTSRNNYNKMNESVSIKKSNTQILKSNKSKTPITKNLSGTFSTNNFLYKPNDLINNKKLLDEFYSKQYYVRNSSPYISEEKQRYLNEKENKKHFISKNNFKLFVGKYSCKPNFIPNYVQMTPSQNPLNHKFREEKKDKWMTKKGFINA